MSYSDFEIPDVGVDIKEGNIKEYVDAVVAWYKDNTDHVMKRADCRRLIKAAAVEWLRCRVLEAQCDFEDLFKFNEIEKSKLLTNSFSETEKLGEVLGDNMRRLGEDFCDKALYRI